MGHQETKFCPACDKWKPRSEFPKNRAKKDGLGSQCKECKRQIQHEWYRKNREQHIAACKVVRQNLVERVQRKVYDYLCAHPCVGCGEDDPVILEFDHRRNKEANVSSLVNQGCSWARVLREIRKCQIRCANCHRRKTAREQRWFTWRLQQETPSCSPHTTL